MPLIKQFFPLAIFLVIPVYSDVSVILGGEADGLFEQSVTTVETYSTKCGLFDANLPPLPKARKLLGAAYLDGSIYICGGYSLLLEVKECFRLDLNSTELGWVQIAPMLKGRFEFHLVAARGLLYAIGGQGPFSEHADIEIYDPNLDKWTESVKFTGFRMGFCSLASKEEDQIYLIGGFDDTGNKRRLESLNLDSMEWTRLADLNQNRSMAGCANFKGGSIVVAGGWGIVHDQVNPVKTAEWYNPYENTWEEFPELHHRRTEFVMGCVDEDYLVAFGGYQGGHMNTVEVFNGSNPDSQWEYLDEYLQEPKSEMSHVTVPDGWIVENC